MSRPEAWLKAWCAVTSCENCRSMSVAKEWADDALKHYDKVVSESVEMQIPKEWLLE